MSGITSGNIIVGAGITLTDANIVGPLTSACQGMSSWTGQMFWGTNVIHSALTPDSDNNTFTGDVEMPDYETIDANWK